MSSDRVKLSPEGYAVLKAYPMGGNLVITQTCPFCRLCHMHINPKFDKRGDVPLRKSHCLDKSISRIAENGTSVGNHIYYLDVQEKPIDDEQAKN
jgi:hypothetical protein